MSDHLQQREVRDMGLMVVVAHTTVADVSGVVTLTAAEGTTGVYVQVFTKAVRYRLDGSDPAAGTGFRIAAGSMVFIPMVTGGTVKLIEEEASASMQYQFV